MALVNVVNMVRSVRVLKTMTCVWCVVCLRLDLTWLLVHTPVALHCIANDTNAASYFCLSHHRCSWLTPFHWLTPSHSFSSHSGCLGQSHMLHKSLSIRNYLWVLTRARWRWVKKLVVFEFGSVCFAKLSIYTGLSTGIHTYEYWV